MEKTLQLELDRSREKPVFNIEISNKEQIRCLVDSGAAIPIWCGTEELFRKCFDVKRLNKRTWLSGFGGKRGYKDVYTMFIKDSADMIKNVYIATTDEQLQPNETHSHLPHKKNKVK